MNWNRWRIKAMRALVAAWISLLNTAMANLGCGRALSGCRGSSFGSATTGEGLAEEPTPPRLSEGVSSVLTVKNVLPEAYGLADADGAPQKLEPRFRSHT